MQEILNALVIPYLKINFLMKIKLDVGLSVYFHVSLTINLFRLTSPKIRVLEVNITVLFCTTMYLIKIWYLLHVILKFNFHNYFSSVYHFVEKKIYSEKIYSADLLTCVFVILNLNGAFIIKIYPVMWVLDLGVKICLDLP